MRFAHEAQVMPPIDSSISVVVSGHAAVTTVKSAVRTTPSTWKSKNSR